MKENVSDYLGIYVYFHVENNYFVKVNVSGDRDALASLLVYSVMLN